MRRIKSITAKELKEKIEKGENLQIIDIRSQQDFDIYHITSAICIPKSKIQSRTELIAKEIPVIIYCRFGSKTKTVIKNLQKQEDFNNLYSLEDGLYQWGVEFDKRILLLI